MIHQQLDLPIENNVTCLSDVFRIYKKLFSQHFHKRFILVFNERMYVSLTTKNKKQDCFFLKHHNCKHKRCQFSRSFLMVQFRKLLLFLKSITQRIIRFSLKQTLVTYVTLISQGTTYTMARNGVTLPVFAVCWAWVNTIFSKGSITTLIK